MFDLIHSLGVSIYHMHYFDLEQHFRNKYFQIDKHLSRNYNSIIIFNNNIAAET